MSSATCPKCDARVEETANFCVACGASLVTDTQSKDRYIGTKVGDNYKILDHIGFGSMGVVYLAEQISLKKKIAIKILKQSYVHNPEILARFEREARAASRLDHPNSISIIDFGQNQEDGAPFIAMEFLDGRDLGEVIHEEFPLDQVRIVNIMLMVCSALDEAHAEGIVHRDLKPANIMVCQRRSGEEYIKVLDFGIAKLNDPDSAGQTLTRDGLIVGTPAFMSPEQVRGDELDERSDIYSLGVILFMMLTGRLPFQANNSAAMAAKILTDRAPLPSKVRLDVDANPVFDAIVHKCIAKDRNARYSNAKELRRDLEMAAMQIAPHLANVTGGFNLAVLAPELIGSGAASNIPTDWPIPGADIETTETDSPDAAPTNGAPARASADTTVMSPEMAEAAIAQMKSLGDGADKASKVDEASIPTVIGMDAPGEDFMADLAAQNPEAMAKIMGAAIPSGGTTREVSTSRPPPSAVEQTVLDAPALAEPIQPDDEAQIDTEEEITPAVAVPPEQASKAEEETPHDRPDPVNSEAPAALVATPIEPIAGTASPTSDTPAVAASPMDTTPDAELAPADDELATVVDMTAVPDQKGIDTVMDAEPYTPGEDSFDDDVTAGRTRVGRGLVTWLALLGVLVIMAIGGALGVKLWLEDQERAKEEAAKPEPLTPDSPIFKALGGCQYRVNIALVRARDKAGVKAPDPAPLDSLDNDNKKGKRKGARAKDPTKSDTLGPNGKPNKGASEEAGNTVIGPDGKPVENLSEGQKKKRAYDAFRKGQKLMGKDAEAALAQFEYAVRLNPAHRNAWVGLHRTSNQLGDTDRAKAACQKVIALLGKRKLDKYSRSCKLYLKKSD